MQRLPPISTDAALWRLPLSDATAMALVDAFLLDDPQAQHNQLSALLSDDPSLSLWTVCAARSFGEETAQTIGELAAWLAHNALDALQWPDEAESACAAERSVDADLADELLVSSIVVARRTAELAVDEPLHSTAFLVGQLHNAAQWFSMSRAEQVNESNDVSHNSLPKWLSAALNDVAGAAESCAEVAPVRQAMNELSACDVDAKSSVLSRHVNEARRIAELWATSIPSSVNTLPRLMRRLARWHDLEVRFAESLEREKLAAMKQLAYGASHEINNPLANISTRAQTLLHGESDPERRRKLATINSQAFRAHEMIANMMLFAHPPTTHPQKFDVALLIDEVIAELSEEAASQGTELRRISMEEPIEITADRDQLAVALKALGHNALEALGCGGRTEYRVQRYAMPRAHAAEHVEISINDTGPGIPPEVRRHLFDPFYSGREAGRGLGFGLSKCWRIVTEHGGRLEVESKPERGTTFYIRLPVAAQANEIRRRVAS